MNKINIGADELILWLRKNGKAANVPNDGVHGLGRKIYDLIISLGGFKVSDNVVSFWGTDLGDENVSQFGLPKKSAQYEIDLDRLPTLFNELMHW